MVAVVVGLGSSMVAVVAGLGSSMVVVVVGRLGHPWWQWL